MKACAFNPCECEARVDDLAENGVYEFRVRAVNRAGESEASASSGAFKVSEYPHGVKAEFTRRLVDCEGASGKDASFSVEFEGRHGVFFSRRVLPFSSIQYLMWACTVKSESVLKN